MDNLFDAEELIVDRVSTAFSTGMVFYGPDITDLDNDDFTKFDIDDDRVGLIIRHAGFKADRIVGDKRIANQRLKTFWQLVIVCPAELYKTVGGVKFVEVVNLLKGYRLSKIFKPMELTDDERDFNEPEFIKDMVYIPMMFIVENVA